MSQLFLIALRSLSFERERERDESLIKRMVECLLLVCYASYTKNACERVCFERS